MTLEYFENSVKTECGEKSLVFLKKKYARKMRRFFRRIGLLYKNQQ